LKFNGRLIAFKGIEFTSIFIAEIKNCILIINESVGNMTVPVGAAIPRFEYLIPLPQDTIAHKKWIEELVRAADSDPSIKL
jgi:hypothetical protein